MGPDHLTLLLSVDRPGEATVTLLRGRADAGLSPRAWRGAHRFDAAQADAEVAALGRSLSRSLRRGRADDALAGHGRLLFDLVLPTPVKAALRDGSGSLTIGADGLDLPWAAFHDGIAPLGLRWSLGELVRGEAAPSPPAGVDRVLVVADPAGDLPAARVEGESLVRHLAGEDGIACDLRAGRLRRADLLRIFKSYRLVHFAGHADPADDAPAGWRLADGRLDAAALAALAGGAAPSLVFVNACQSVSEVTDALLDAGVRHVVATVVDLPDLPGAELATRFYAALRAGHPVGEALRIARVAAAEVGSTVWAAYRLFGDPRLPYFRATPGSSRWGTGVRRGVVLAARRATVPELDPEALVADLSAWRDRVRAEVTSRGGRLLPGRGAVDRAVFGLPVSFENDAERARAAGEALAEAGAVVTVEAGPLGSTGADVVGRAAIDAEAAAWSHAAGLHLLPGAVALTAERDDGPFVGREAELDRLSAVASTLPAAVTVLGPAGIGKTRLVDRLVEQLGGRFRVLRGAGVPYDSRQPYAAVAAALRDLLGEPSLDGLAAHLDRLDDADDLEGLSIDALLRSGPRLRDRLGVLAAVMGLADAPRGLDPGAVPVAVRELVEVSARDRPLLVVFEDLHWLPPAGLAVVAELAAAREARLLVLCTARNELLDHAPRWLDDTAMRRLDLGPLEDEDARRLLAAFAADDPTLLARAEGNPLFLRELALSRMEGAAAPSATVEGVLRARLDRQPPPFQQVLRGAAVVGRTFWAEGLARVLDEDVGAALEALQRARFVSRQPTSEIPGATQWRFTHALLHEVVLQGCDPRSRRAWHGRAALWLAAEVPGANAARVAAHWAAAGDDARAAEAWLRAAAEATAALAPGEARRAYVEALAADDRGSHLTPEARAAAEESVAELAFADGELDEAARRLEDALGRTPDGGARVERLRRLAEVEEARGALQAARARLAEALALDPEALLVRRDQAWLDYRDGRYAEARVALEALVPGAGAQSGEVHNPLGAVAYRLGDYAAADRHYRLALRAFDEVGDPRRVAVACNNLGILAMRQGDTSGAEGWYRRAVRIQAERGDRTGLALAYNNLGTLYGESGDFARAARFLEESVRIRERAGHGSLAVGYANLGEVHQKVGDLDEAERYLERALSLCAEGRGPAYLVPDVWRMLAELHLERGAPERAIAAATTAREAALGSDDLPRAGVATLVLGEACARVGDPRADGFLAEAVEVLEGLERPIELARAYETRARHLGEGPEADRLRRDAEALRGAVGGGKRLH